MKTTVKGTEYRANGTGHTREFVPITAGNIADELTKYRGDLLRDFNGISGELTAEDENGEIIARQVLTFEDGEPVWNTPDQWWKFGGDNLQARYGYGTHAQALEYVAYLNRNREINQFFIMDADRPDTDLCDEWPDLGDELAAIAHNDEDAQ